MRLLDDISLFKNRPTIRFEKRGNLAIDVLVDLLGHFEITRLLQTPLQNTAEVSDSRKLTLRQCCESANKPRLVTMILLPLLVTKATDFVKLDPDPIV